MNGKPDFKARITFLTEELGGRRTPAKQGYRTDFLYEDLRDGYIIWPIFPKEDGTPFEDLAEIPMVVGAHMSILSNELRVSVHQQRIKIGLSFLVSEGSHVVARGEVVEILGLFDPRQAPTF